MPDQTTYNPTDVPQTDLRYHRKEDCIVFVEDRDFPDAVLRVWETGEILGPHEIDTLDHRAPSLRLDEDDDPLEVYENIFRRFIFRETWDNLSPTAKGRWDWATAYVDRVERDTPSF